MDDLQVVIMLMTMGIILIGLASWIAVPYPLTLVIGGMAISFYPPLSAVKINPQIILALILPPILYHASFWISYSEFKRYWKDIFSLALGLVVATTIVIALLFKFIFPDLPWALAYLFGAIISPPDAAAATAILKKFSIKSKLETILEGESLINDASALVLCHLAVIALLTGSFSEIGALTEFAYIAVGGVLLGVIFGYSLQLFSKKYLPPTVGIIFSFVIPYITYIAADRLEVSGVLAVVVNGLIGARILISHESSFRRLYGVNAWDVFMILLNCFVFVLIGLEVNDIVEVMPWDSIFLNIFYAFVFWGAMMAVRMFWVFFKHSGFYLRNLSRWRASSSYVETLSQDLILGWAGIRGIVSLTVALAIPRFMNDGTLTPGRDLVIFLTFAVIMISLLVPGFSLPWLLNKLSLHRKESRGEIEKTRQYLAKVAEDEIHALHQNQKLNDEEKSFFNNYFNVRQLIFANAMEMGDRQIELLRRKVVQRQRQMLIGQWQGGQIDDHILKVLERELDLEETLTDRPEV